MSSEPHRTHRIAVIDDESESLASICRALKKVGYDIFSFEDGLAAVQSLDSFRDVDLVVTDLKMPRVDGIDLLKKVREVNREAGFLIVTGHGTVETAVEALKAGADDYIIKPLDLFELRNRVRQILEKRQPGNELRFLRRQIATDSSVRARSLASRLRFSIYWNRSPPLLPRVRLCCYSAKSGTGKDLAAQTIHA